MTGKTEVNILIAKVGSIRLNEIKVLADALTKKHRVTIVTMAEEASHRGQAFSFRGTPVRVNPFQYKDMQVYEFYNNPADAISVMMCEIMAHRKPDLVICGISNGVHMGQDIYCSSNIGMAMEAAFFDVPSIAVGIEYRPGGHSELELKNAITFIEKNIEKFIALKLPKHTFLNINIPTVKTYKQLKGVKAASMSRMSQLSAYVERTDANGDKYYWADNAERKNTDTGEEYARTWFDRGYITIVPLNYDATDYAAVKSWNDRVIKDIKKDAGGEK